MRTTLKKKKKKKEKTHGGKSSKCFFSTIFDGWFYFFFYVLYIFFHCFMDFFFCYCRNYLNDKWLQNSSYNLLCSALCSLFSLHCYAWMCVYVFPICLVSSIFILIVIFLLLKYRTHEFCVVFFFHSNFSFCQVITMEWDRMLKKKSNTNNTLRNNY